MMTLSRNMKTILAMISVTRPLVMMPRHAKKIVNVWRKVTLRKNAQRMEDFLNAALGKIV